jgi:hypothetical protein
MLVRGTDRVGGAVAEPSDRFQSLWLSFATTAASQFKHVHTEIANTFLKLGLHSRAELMGWLKRANDPLYSSKVSGWAR